VNQLKSSKIFEVLKNSEENSGNSGININSDREIICDNVKTFQLNRV
jgi:hypothetical protein